MKKKSFITALLICFFAICSFGKTEVLSLITELESLLDTSISIWKTTEADPPGAEKLSFDDSSWVKKQTVFTSTERVTWLRQTVRIPEIFSGVKISKSPVNLSISFVGVGIVEGQYFINGKKVDSFSLDFGNSSREIEKTFSVVKQSEPGTEILIAFRLENKGRLPLIEGNKADVGAYIQVRKTKLAFPDADASLKKLSRFILDLKLGATLLDLSPEENLPPHKLRPISTKYKKNTDTKKYKRLKEIFIQAAAQFDLPSLVEGNYSKVEASLKSFYLQIQPVISFAKNYTIYLGGNSHIDIAWLWRWPETVEVAKATFSTVLDNMEEYPGIIYIQSQAQLYKWIEEKYPELFQRIKNKVKEGRWEIVGGMWVEPDCNLIDGESFIRQILYGKRYFREKFNVDVRIGWNPDSFGYNWNMPQFFKKSGVDTFVTQKISWNDTTVFPYFLFWWEGPDNSRILTYFPPTGYVGRLQAENMVKGLKEYEKNTGLRESYILYGLGDHGGGPNREMLDRVASYKDQALIPRLVHSSFNNYIEKIKKNISGDIPTWKDELYLEYHRGTYTTQAKTKRNNRKSEILLADSEKISSIASLLGKDYPRDEIKKAWEKALFNQFHDILPGSSIHPVYRDADEFYEEVFRITSNELTKSLLFLGRKINTKTNQEGTPLLVFNTLSWNRTCLVKVPLPSRIKGNVTVYDNLGNALPGQILEKNHERILCFIAQDIPSLGYRIFKIKAGARLSGEEPLRVDKNSLENSFYRIILHPDTGNIISLFDKISNREVIAPNGQGNQLQLFEDKPSQWDAWNIGYTGRSWKLDNCDQIQIGEKGPVLVSIKVKKSFLGLSKARSEPTSEFPSSFFSQEIMLYRDLPRIDINMEADWWEDHVLLKVAFPVDVQSENAVYEIPFASVQRPTSRNTPWEKARFEVPAIRWADLSDGNYGVSLINNCKYGYDIEKNIIRLTLLRSPRWPDPLADRGKHIFSYSLYPHRGDWKESEVVRRAYEFNSPLLAVFLEEKDIKGELPPSASFFSVQPENIVLVSIKKAEDRESLILRLYESQGRPVQANMQFHNIPALIFETDLMESRKNELFLENNMLKLDFGSYEIKTIELVFK